MLDGKRVVLGVTGGIAAYKAIEVCRRLVDGGAHVFGDVMVNSDDDIIAAPGGVTSIEGFVANLGLIA